MFTTPVRRGAALLAAAVAFLAAAPSAAPSAAPKVAWDTKEKCVQKDWDGRRVPTRMGNSVLGFRHLSGPHNITTCRLINAALNGKPDKKSDQNRNLEYWGSAINRGRQVDFVVKIRYAKSTDDGKYTAPGAKGKVGVITAYCKGMRKCPSWVN